MERGEANWRLFGGFMGGTPSHRLWLRLPLGAFDSPDC